MLYKMAREFICPRCCYVSKTSSNLLRHLRNKRICDPIKSTISQEQAIKDYLGRKGDEFICQICEKTYQTRQGLHWHIKNHHPNSDESLLIQELRQEIEVLRRKVHSSSPNVNTQNNIQTQNNCQTQNNIQNQIVINAFGKEDISYLTNSPDFKDFIMKCLEMRQNGICKYISSKHFDSEHPENHNIRKLNKKDRVIEYHDGTSWISEFKNYVVNTILKDIETDVRNFLENSFSEYNPLSKEAQITLDHYMEAVGKQFEWDLDCDNYNYDDSNDAGPSKHDQEEFRKYVYEMIINHIYAETKKVHNKTG